MAEIGSNAVGSSDEQFLFRENEIFISKLRFIAENQTYAMSGITSVKFEAIPAGLAVPILLVMVGVIAGMIGALKFAVVVVALGIFVGYRRAGRYSVTLGTAGGEVRSYISRDKEFVGRIVKALNDAIVLRG